MADLSIGQLAKQTKTTIDTLRFYERVKLIKPAYRKMSGYRQYHPSMVEIISFIRRAKSLGFTLAEIRELLSFRESSQRSAHEVKQKASAKIEKINDKIQELLRIRKELSHLTTSCDGSGTARDCPILEGIAGGFQQ